MTSYLCPDCRRELDRLSTQEGRDLRCPEGHRFTEEDGVLRLVGSELAPRLRSFNEILLDYRQREGKRILDEEVYQHLPFGEAEKGSFDWRIRCHDLEILRRLLESRRELSVLDVGSYNGWLAHRLTEDGHQVTAVDYFADPHDGLGARRFYPRAEWRSIQLDLRDLAILGGVYDVVVLNRCLQFFADPTAYFQHARELVAAGGVLVATGLDLLRDPRRKQRAIAALEKRYRERYDIGFFLHPTRGYLDFRDGRRLRAAGLEIRPYPQLWRTNLLARFVPTRPRLSYGVYAVGG